MFAGQDTGQNMNFGYGPANDVARRLLTLWNTYRFLVLNANPEGFRPLWEEADRGPESDNPLDRWVIARASELARDCRAALDAYDSPSMTRAVEAFWDDLSNWYVRRSRPRFWEGDRAAFATLHHALVQCLRLMGPVTPFLADEMWQNLVANGCGADAPGSVHLAGYPEADEARIAAGLLSPMADVRAICELGHRARADAKLRVRQPLASAIVGAADAARLEALTSSGLLEEIASELNVKLVTTTSDLESLVAQQVVPNFRELGPRLGAKVQEVRGALVAGAYELGDDGVVHVSGEQLAARRVRAALARARGLRGPDRRNARGRHRHARDRRARPRGHRARCRAVPPERAQGARASRSPIASRSATRPTSVVRRCWLRTATWIAREVLAQRFEPGDGGDHRFAAGGAEIAFEVAARVSASARAVVFDCDGLLIDSEVPLGGRRSGAWWSSTGASGRRNCASASSAAQATTPRGASPSGSVCRRPQQAASSPRSTRAISP